MHASIFRWPSWLIYTALTLFVTAASVWFAITGTLEPKDIGTGMLALIGTLVGALLAFRLEEGRERTREEAARKAAINRALLVLGYHHNEVRTYCDLILPYNSILELAFFLPASQPPEQAGLRQQLDELRFLLDSSDPQVLFDLVIEQSRFDQVIQVIRIRNALYADQAQPAIVKGGFVGRHFTAAELERALGEWLFGCAMHAAQAMREHLLASNESLPALATKLRTIAKQLYPEEKFVSFTNIPLPNESVAVRAGQQATG